MAAMMPEAAAGADHLEHGALVIDAERQGTLVVASLGTASRALWATVMTVGRIMMPQQHGWLPAAKARVPGPMSDARRAQ